MSEHPTIPPPWSVPLPVAEIPETGLHVEPVADEATRAALAGAAGVVALPRLAASFDLTRHGEDGVRVVGTVSALVRQNCVVTLEPMETVVEEAVDLVFAPRQQPEPGKPSAKATIAVQEDEQDPPEPLVDGVIDLGAVATEFLLLGIDPYPRKPGATFEAPAADDPAFRPFAALAALKRPPGGEK